MLDITIWLALLVGGLACVAFVKARNVHRASKSVIDAMDRSAKRVGLISLAPGIGTAVWLIMRGVAPPVGVIVGAVCALGVFAVLLSILRMEGLLLETTSAAEYRIAQGLASPSTPRGRVVAALLGAVAICISAYAIWVVIR